MVVSPAHLAVTYVLLCSCVSSDRITYVEFTSTYAKGSPAHLQPMNGLGVTIIGKSSMTFYIKACEAAAVAVADITSIRNDDGNYFIFILAGPQRRRNIVMNSCFACSSRKSRIRPVLECDTYKQFWMTWGKTGATLGQGAVIGKKKLLHYRSNNDNEFNFLLASSISGHTTHFKFPVVNKLLFIKPADDGSTIVEIPETYAIGTVILTIKVNMENVTFEVTGEHAHMFEIQGKELKTKKSFKGSKLSLYTLNISTNIGTHVCMHVAVKKMGQNLPTITQGFVRTVTEELPVGTMIGGIFTMTSGNQNNSLTFNLEGEDSEYFDVTSGGLTIKRRIDRESRQLKGRNLGPITLKVKDGHNIIAETSLVLTVQDINDNVPTFSSPIFRVSVTENTTYDEPILQLDCADVDDGINGQFQIHILPGDDVDSIFRLEGDMLYVDGLRVDYETAAAYEFMYILRIHAVDMATSGHVNTGSTVVVVQILPQNEHAPRWIYPLPDENGSFPDQTIFENQTVGSVILTMQATDDDIGIGSDVIFILRSVKTDKGSNALHHFHLDPQHGTLINTVNLDCDDEITGTQHYFLSIQAADGHFSIQAELKLIIRDVDDNDPIFEQEYFIISPPFVAGQLLFVFTITDDDVISNVDVEIDSPQSSWFYVEADVKENAWRFISTIDLDSNSQVPNYVILKTRNRRMGSRDSEAIVVIYRGEEEKNASNDVTSTEYLCTDDADVMSARDGKQSSKCVCD